MLGMIHMDKKRIASMAKYMYMVVGLLIMGFALEARVRGLEYFHQTIVDSLHNQLTNTLVGNIVSATKTYITNFNTSKSYCINFATSKF